MVGVGSTERENLTSDIPEIDFGVISIVLYFTRHVSDRIVPNHELKSKKTKKMSLNLTM